VPSTRPGVRGHGAVKLRVCLVTLIGQQLCLLNEAWDILRNNQPDDVEVHQIVAVRQPVARTVSFGQGEVWVSLSKSRVVMQDDTCSLPNDFDALDAGELKHLIRDEILIRRVAGEALQLGSPAYDIVEEL
jgi:hypothetical protein